MAQDKRKSLINVKSKLLSESDHSSLFDLFQQRCIVSYTII